MTASISNHSAKAYGPGGGARGAALGNSDFLGSKRKFGQSLFLKTSLCLFNYFEDLPTSRVGYRACKPIESVISVLLKLIIHVAMIPIGLIKSSLES